MILKFKNYHCTVTFSFDKIRPLLMVDFVFAIRAPSLFFFTNFLKKSKTHLDFFLNCLPSPAYPDNSASCLFKFCFPSTLPYLSTLQPYITSGRISSRKLAKYLSGSKYLYYRYNSHEYVLRLLRCFDVCWGWQVLMFAEYDKFLCLLGMTSFYICWEMTSSDVWCVGQFLKFAGDDKFWCLFWMRFSDV